MLHMVRLDVSQHPMLVIIVHHTASIAAALIPANQSLLSFEFHCFPFPKMSD